MFVKRKNRMLLRTVFVFLGLLFAVSAHAQSASLLVSPPSGSFEKGKTFSVKIMAESDSNINAAEVDMTFDKDILAVASISKSGSAFSLWTTEPTFSNTKGTINFGGGSPSPFSGKKTLATVVFKAKNGGVGKVAFSSGNVLAADGKGTDILSEKKGGEYTVVATAEPVLPEPVEPIGFTPDPPTIISDFSDPEKWHAITEATFKWSLAYDIIGVRLLFNEDPVGTPSVTYDPPISEKTLTDMEEGVWYLHVAFSNNAGWGTPAHQKIQIDLTPPADFSVQAEQKDSFSQDVTLTFEAIDDLSGIGHYEIMLDETSQGAVSPDDLVGGSHIIYVADLGEHAFSITAFDAAGNSTVSKVDLTVEEALISKKQTPSPVEEEEEPGFNWQYWITLFLVAVIAFLIGTVIYERRAMRAEKEYIKKEADEAREKLEVIFTVLRIEIEEQIIAIATKPNMTESERQILEKLKEALEISEELLDKEIEDVRKLVQ
jgi:hypothetical protein